MRTRLTFVAAAFALAAAGSVHAQQQAQSGAKAGGDNQPAAVLMLVPVEVSSPAMKSGCWAQLYDERNFKGDVLTIAGPIQLMSTDNSSGRSLRRNVDSLVTGPKATLVVFEHKMFKDKSVTFGPNTKEAGLIKKLGFTGRIESLKLDCAS
jgi:hypothetical protein